MSSSFPIVAGMSNQWLREAFRKIAQEQAAEAKKSPATAAALKLTETRIEHAAYVPCVDTSGAVDLLLEAAKQHGEDSEPDHEVGDLQDILRAVWKVLTPYQRSQVLRSSEISQVLEGAAQEPLASKLEDTHDWELVCEFYGLDTSFLYGEEQVLEYTNMFRLDALRPADPAESFPYLFGEWTFNFACAPAGDRRIRLACDCSKAKVVALQVLNDARDAWVAASPDQVADLQDALASEDYSDVFEAPAAFNLAGSHQLPHWAKDLLQSAPQENAAAHDGASADLRYVHGTWEHIFHPGRAAATVRLIYDRQEAELVAMEIRARGGWAFATREEIADVEDSLQNANSEAIDNPHDFGLEASDTRPQWCAEEVRRLTER